MKEESIEFQTPDAVFYNPKMNLCRSLSSLAVGALEDEIDVVDAFCATGIRGIRYARENANVKSLTFLDIEEDAIMVARKNAMQNKLTAEFKTGSISRLAFDLMADFVEIDPFGTPSPYITDSLRFFNPKKTAYLSVTATDVAVLCGGKTAPCLKNYHSKPLNNEFTHETGLRIMIKKIAENAAEFNFGITPLVSFSDKHYLKTVIKLKRGADNAFRSMKSLGYVSYDPKTGNRNYGRFPETGDQKKETAMEYAGPLWLGEIHDKEFLEKMKKLNNERNYSEKDEINHMISLFENEVAMPPYYYNIHNLCRIFKTGHVPKMKKLLERLVESGYRAERTHFSRISFKSDAPFDKIREVFQ
ncbi:tRNA (guanine(10)-N(2))-dimethyltransferase [Candidatus Micrarchaeota archaeon]|nr:tRNA (guanine(10)-N(2))-dimethyltransferase [Candidatus Micrarchaeota archaeon]